MGKSYKGDEEFVKEIKEAVDFHGKGEHYQKDVAVVWDGRQFSIKIPKKVAEIAEIKKDSKFRFHLEPDNDDFRVEVELIKDDKD